MAVGGGLGFVVIIILVTLLGGDPTALLTGMSESGGPGLDQLQTGTGQISPEEEELASFSKVVLADTEDVWTQLFQKQGRRYEMPNLVLFRQRVQSACGMASAASGPFYCPADHKAYLDVSFFEEMSRELQAPGDFAQAYVIAHEIGHHVQNLLGIMDDVQSRQNRMSRDEANALSVRLELQADFLAGVWAHHADRLSDILEPGDIEEALRAASAIGDDRLQMQSQGYVVPESFTHGTSQQRVYWFRLGYQTGDLSAGDTFAEGTP